MQEFQYFGDPFTKQEADGSGGVLKDQMQLNNSTGLWDTDWITSTVLTIWFGSGVLLKAIGTLVMSTLTLLVMIVTQELLITNALQAFSFSSNPSQRARKWLLSQRTGLSLTSTNVGAKVPNLCTFYLGQTYFGVRMMINTSKILTTIGGLSPNDSTNMSDKMISFSLVNHRD